MDVEVHTFIHALSVQVRTSVGTPLGSVENSSTSPGLAQAIVQVSRTPLHWDATCVLATSTVSPQLTGTMLYVKEGSGRL